MRPPQYVESEEMRSGYIVMRVTPSFKTKLQRAATRRGITLSRYVRNAAAFRATRDLKKK